MANPWAGEVALVLDGQRHVAKLTLGALAELEAALAGELTDAERIEKSRLLADLERRLERQDDGRFGNRAETGIIDAPQAIMTIEVIGPKENRGVGGRIRSD